MEQELAYSFHLGSDKNKSKVAKKTAKGNVSGTTSLSNNAIQNANDLSRVNKHNLRDYDNQRDLITTIYGTNDIVEDVKQVYLDEFEQARIEYNTNQPRADRRINNYFEKICNSQNDIACEIIIELGDMDFWQDKDEEYRFKMIDVYNEQIQDLNKILPSFKVANATIHFDETSPHMHVIGVPVIENCKRGMEKQVGKSQLFTKESLTKIQDKMRNTCIKSYNKFYDVDSRLKTKQKGRNQDINVKEMDNYREMKKYVLFIVCAIAVMMSCKNKGQASKASGADSTAVDSVLAELNDTTPLPMMLYYMNPQNMMMVYWIDPTEPEKTKDNADFYNDIHNGWGVQNMFTRNAPTIPKC